MDILNIYAENKQDYRKIIKQLKKDGFNKKLDGYVEVWMRNEWTKDSTTRKVYIHIEY